MGVEVLAVAGIVTAVTAIYSAYDAHENAKDARADNKAALKIDYEIGSTNAGIMAEDERTAAVIDEGNALIFDKRGNAILEQGIYDQELLTQQHDAAKSTQRQRLSFTGLDLKSGSPLQLMKETADRMARDVEQVGKNATASANEQFDRANLLRESAKRHGGKADVYDDQADLYDDWAAGL